jgi:hypothetical protein
MFGMLDTSQIFIPFNPMWSHNVAHNCDHANFTVDSCYGILQHLLRICMSAKASVKFQAVSKSKSSTCLIFYDFYLTNKIYFVCRSDKAVVSWTEVQG